MAYELNRDSANGSTENKRITITISPEEYKRLRTWALLEEHIPPTTLARQIVSKALAARV